MVRTPLLLLVYNRLDTLQKVWEAIRLAQPKYLFISGDGPKESKESQKAVAAVRRFCETSIDWPCEAHFQWLPTNHGHKRGVLKGIFWFFAQVSEGIVLEDDTLPIPDFFPFCEALLEKYRDEPRVGMIGGFNLVPSQHIPYQHDFIRLLLVWGWASWRRTWEGYDPNMKDWAHLRKTDFLARVTRGNRRLKTYLQNLFDRSAGLGPTYLDSWDFPLTYHFLKKGLLTAFPHTNLVGNLGLGHAAAVNTGASRLLPAPQPFPLELPPPPFIYPNLLAEAYLTRAYWNPPFYYRAYLRIKADLAYGALWKTFTSRRFWQKAIRIALRKN